MLLFDLTRNSNKTGNQGAFPLGTHPSLSGIWKYTSTPRHVQPVGEVHDTNYTSGWDFRTENVCWDFLTFSEGWRTSAWTVEVHSKRSTHSTGTLQSGWTSRDFNSLLAPWYCSWIPILVILFYQWNENESTFSCSVFKPFCTISDSFYP